ncbi:MAG: HPP family protein [Pseudomonadota bacterium]
MRRHDFKRLGRWWPAPSGASRGEQWRAGLGALCGLLLTGLLSLVWLGPRGVVLIAPMGASAVLLFCLPASPLAQPWSVIGGNVISALVGISCARYLGDGPAVAALAGALAIGAMFALRCLHPPGGAVALTAVLGGPAIHAAGYGFAFAPAGANTLLLVAGAIVYNNLSGKRYPHRQTPPQTQHSLHATRDAAPTERLGFTSADLDAVLARYGQVIDISRDELATLFLQTEMQAHQRRFGVITCADIMSKDIISAEFGAGLEAAWRLMREHRISALPVLNRARRVIGMATQSDFLRHGGIDDYRGLRAQLRHFLRPSPFTHSDKAEVVGQIMAARPRTVGIGTPITDLVPLMANSGLHQIAVVDGEARFAGMVTQSDLVAALYESGLAEIGARAPGPARRA